MLRALKSGDGAEQIILKLTKKAEYPFLSFEIRSRLMSVTQDVPISLQTPKVRRVLLLLRACILFFSCMLFVALGKFRARRSITRSQIYNA